MSEEIRIRFRHGIGDCTYAAHQLQLYISRGYSVTVDCDPEKAILFEPFGINVEHHEAFPRFNWIPASPVPIDADNYWSRHKAFYNLGRSPLPDIGPLDGGLFARFSSLSLRISPFLAEHYRSTLNEVQVYFDELPKPIILLHTKGNSYQESKSVPDSQCMALYRALLDELGGTIVLLDWDNRVPRASTYRLRHLTSDWKWLDLPTLLATIDGADLLIGIDSGPLHLCRFTNTPAIGMWFNDHHPCEYSLPRKGQVNFVLKRFGENYNRFTRIPFNIIECQEQEFPPFLIARVARQMLTQPLYKNATGIADAGDVQLQHFIHDFTRGNLAPGVSVFNDRNVGFDLLCRHIKSYANPLVVETGCIRAEEDFRGAGFATYVLGAALYRLGRGHLDSVDNNPENIAFARKRAGVFGLAVQTHQADSVTYLRERSDPIDVLYLDSMDTALPDSAAHGLEEIRAGERLLTPNAMVAYDDTYWAGGGWHGKGSLGVPYLLESGWRIRHSGWQTILVRK